ncbi:MAG: hypothetical protein HGN29_03190 [Asgard group archaeon]|nr:hypothetical protein [Asgard group archaeon]
MTSAEGSSSTIIRERKRYEKLGFALNKAGSISTWLKVLFATTLILGLPTLPLLSDPLKDGTTTLYQIVIFGFRVLLIAMIIFLALKITSQVYTAKNDFDIKLAEIGFKDPNANTKEENRLVNRNVVFTVMKILILVASGLGVFLAGSRDNYGYIIGQEVVYIVLISGLVFTIKFWSSKDPKYSPRMGGRNLILVFLPLIYLFGFEIIIDFFSVLSEPRFHFNTLQITWGLMYPFMFIFILIAVLISSKKTIREKITMQDARLAEFKRRESLLEDKGFFAQFKYSTKTNWNEFSQIFFRRESAEKRDIDKKPNEILVKSIWISLFAIFIPFGLILPWNLFPHDGLLVIAALIVGYQYSMIKYDREEIDVLSEPEKNEEIDPPEIRTNSMAINTTRLILLPTIVFVVTQYLISGIISNPLAVVGFTWISLLLVIPISIQLITYINANTKNNRTLENIRMHRNLMVILALVQLVFLVGSVIGRYMGKEMGLEFFLPTIAIIMQAVLLLVLLIVPIVYQYILPKLDDKQFKIVRIVFYLLIAILNVLIIAWFIVDILSTFGILTSDFYNNFFKPL